MRFSLPNGSWKVTAAWLLESDMERVRTRLPDQKKKARGERSRRLAYPQADSAQGAIPAPAL
jgi:hypothetical protein